MRLSISARIFGGFLLVLVAFGAVMGYTFYRMHRLRQDLHLLSNSYLRQALILAELHTIQGNLLNTVAERSIGRGTSKFLRTQVRLARVYRVREVQRALRVVQRSHALNPGRRDRQILDDVEKRLKALSRSFHEHEALFDQLFDEMGSARAGEVERVGESLLRRERKLATLIRRLRDELRNQVTAAALQVEEEETRSVYAILGMVVLALLVSVAVTYAAQLTLRPLKKLLAGTRRIGAGDYAHRVDVRSRDELGDLAQEFNNMAGALEEREQRLIRSERMATVGRMAAHVTHEIRNPLSSISLNTELLEEEVETLSGPSAAETRSLLQAIRKEVDRLTDFTEEYLRFARLPRPHLEKEDIQEILQDLITFLGGELHAHGVRLHHELRPGDSPVLCDENQLRQAFLNLIRNAIEAMAPQGGGDIRITVCRRDNLVEIAIADSGPGITAEDRLRIFEPFFSTKESGTGLGLALTQQILLEHGGSIEVDSPPAQGAVFLVRLPAAV